MLEIEKSLRSIFENLAKSLIFKKCISIIRQHPHFGVSNDGQTPQLEYGPKNVLAFWDIYTYGIIPIPSSGPLCSFSRKDLAIN